MNGNQTPQPLRANLMDDHKRVTKPAADRLSDDQQDALIDAAVTDASEDERKRHIDELVLTIKEAADKFAQEGGSRGDLKLLSRAIRELRYAFKVFSPYRNVRKVSIFGSARTPPDDPSYAEAVRLGKAFADEDWFVITGAASGIMEAGHRGAGREHSMGLNIMLPFEQQANPVILGDSKLVHMKYFFTRKLMFVKECDAVVCLPGGFGTLDEAMEVITLLQTGKRDLVPVVLLDPPGGTYWPGFAQFIERHLLGGKMISPEDKYLYKVCDRYEEAVAEVLQFFKVYHSMRYVRRDLVLRLQQPLEPQLLDAINSEFADILSEGAFTQREALPAERDDPDIAHLPRLVFPFNRRSIGRLRLLIDVINRGSIT